MRPSTITDDFTIVPQDVTWQLPKELSHREASVPQHGAEQLRQVQPDVGNIDGHVVRLLQRFWKAEKNPQRGINHWYNIKNAPVVRWKLDWLNKATKLISCSNTDSFIFLIETNQRVHMNWPFVEEAFRQDSLLHQLEEELAHLVPGDATALQGRLHPDTHKDVQLRAQIKLVHTLDSLLQETQNCDQDWGVKNGLLNNSQHT